MKIDLRKLYALNKLELDNLVLIPKEYYEKMGVKSMDKVHVTGTASINYERNIELNLTVTGKFIIPCQISFEDVDVPFNTSFMEEIDENTVNDEFYLDLLDILWENIVLEIPMRVVKEGVKIENLQGEGWELKEEI